MMGMRDKGLIVAVVATGLSLGGLMMHGNAEIRRDIRSLQEDVGDLRERMARLEGLFEGHLNKDKP